MNLTAEALLGISTSTFRRNSIEYFMYIISILYFINIVYKFIYKYHTNHSAIYTPTTTTFANIILTTTTSVTSTLAIITYVPIISTNATSSSAATTNPDTDIFNTTTTANITTTASRSLSYSCQSHPSHISRH